MTADFDVFISYNRRDVEPASEIERSLDGLRVYRDQAALRIGDPWFSNVIDAVYAARFVVALLTPDYLASPICRAELFHALSRDADGANRVVLPVLLRRTQLPAAVRLLNHLDATGMSTADLAMALRGSIDAALSGTAVAAPPTPDDERMKLVADLSPEAASIVRVLRMARRALANMETRAAGHTALTLPATLEIELEDKREEVAALEERLRRLAR